VPAAKQREALELVCDQMFTATPFNFPPELYNKLAASKWSHWGVEDMERHDYPAHQAILMWQERVLEQLLSDLTLSRIHDAELKLAADEDAFTTAELLTTLTDSMFAELVAEIAKRIASTRCVSRRSRVFAGTCSGLTSIA
jgi:hypothetical protein